MKFFRLIFFLTLFQNEFAQAQMQFMQNIMGPQGPPGSAPPIIRLQGSFNSDTNTEDSQKLENHEGSVGLRIPGTTINLNASASQKTLGSQSITLEDGTPVENKLESIQYGMGFSRETDSGYKLSFSGGYGSSSDAPFENSRDISYQASFSVLTPGDKSRWLLGALYTNNGPLGAIPLPLIVYIYTPSREFRLIAGLPFLMIHMGAKTRLTLMASPAKGFVQLSQSLFGPISIFTKWEIGVSSFFHSNRVNDDDQFFVRETKAVAGLRSPIFPGAMLTVSGGWRYDSIYFQGESLFSGDTTDFDLKDSTFLQANLALRF